MQREIDLGSEIELQLVEVEKKPTYQEKMDEILRKLDYAIILAEQRKKTK